MPGVDAAFVAARLHPFRRLDRGFTLIELSVVMSIVGLLGLISVWGFRQYAAAQGYRGTANAVESSMRNAAERAVSEGRAYCVSFDSPTTWSVWRYSCDPAWTDGTHSRVLVSGHNKVQTSNASLGGVSFSTPTGGCASGSLGCAYFYPRGNSSTGQITVSRPGSTGFVVKVEGLTGRVYLG